MTCGFCLLQISDLLSSLPKSARRHMQKHQAGRGGGGGRPSGASYFFCAGAQQNLTFSSEFFRKNGFPFLIRTTDFLNFLPIFSESVSHFLLKF